MTDEFQQFTHDIFLIELDKLLPTSIVTITHTKKDGEERTRRVTLCGQAIPHDKRPIGTGRLPAEGMKRVFDVDLQEWRTIIVANTTINSWELIPTND